MPGDPGRPTMLVCGVIGRTPYREDGVEGTELGLDRLGAAIGTAAHFLSA